MAAADKINLSCPAGWTVKKGGGCTDRATPAKASFPMAEVCDEKWGDWFSVPNYHLGNGYIGAADSKKCYKPCGKYYFPNYKTDPPASTFVKELVDKCVSKSNWNPSGLGTGAGNYAGTQDFCPLAVIKQISSTPETLRKEMINSMKTKGCSEQTPAIALMEKGVDQAAKDLSKAIHSRLENVNDRSRLVGNMKAACNGPLMNTPERVADAYETCARLANDPEKFVDDWEDSIAGTEEDKQKHLTILRQACNVAFCGSSSPLSLKAQLGSEKPDLCYDNIWRINTTLTTQLPGSGMDPDEEDVGSNPSAGGAAMLHGSVYLTLLVLSSPLLIILLMILIFFVWPLIVGTICSVYNNTLVRLVYNIQWFWRGRDSKYMGIGFDYRNNPSLWLSILNC